MARPPEPGDLVVHGLAALDLADKGGARPLAQDVARKQHHELVAPHDAARRIDDAQAIRVAIERDAQLGAALSAHGSMRSVRLAGTVGSG